MTESETHRPVDAVFRTVDRRETDLPVRSADGLLPDVGGQGGRTAGGRHVDDRQQRIRVFGVVIDVETQPVIQEYGVETDGFLHGFLPLQIGIAEPVDESAGAEFILQPRIIGIGLHGLVSIEILIPGITDRTSDF